MAVEQLHLGSAVNLLEGLRPAPVTDRGHPFPLAPQQPFRPLDLDAADPEAPWQAPTLSFCRDLGELVDALFDYRVLPFQADGGRPFRLPASSLILHGAARHTALVELGSLLGLEIRPDEGYLLLGVRRKAGDFLHEAEKGGIGRFIAIKDYWTAAGRHAMARLRTSGKTNGKTNGEAPLSARQAQRYLDYFYAFGTHFLSRIVVGQAFSRSFAAGRSAPPSWPPPCSAKAPGKARSRDRWCWRCATS